MESWEYNTFGLFADELEDAFPEYRGSMVWGDRNDIDHKGEIISQSLSIKLKFLLKKSNTRITRWNSNIKK